MVEKIKNLFVVTLEDGRQNRGVVYLRGFHLVGLECFCMAFQSAAIWVHGSLCHADGSLSSHGDFLAD